MRDEMNGSTEQAAEQLGDSIPSWAQDLGLDPGVFAMLLHQSLLRGVAPTDLAREWVTEMAKDLSR